jgi:hypothetical protein
MLETHNLKETKLNIKEQLSEYEIVSFMEHLRMSIGDIAYRGQMALKFIELYNEIKKGKIDFDFNLSSESSVFSERFSWEVRDFCHGESLLSILMQDVSRQGNEESITKLLRLKLDYKLTAFGICHQFFTRIVKAMNSTIPDERFAGEAVLTQFLYSDNIDDKDKVNLINRLSYRESSREYLNDRVFNQGWFKQSILSTNKNIQALSNQGIINEDTVNDYCKKRK